MSDLGPLQPLFDDDLIEEIFVNRPDRVFVKTSAGRQRREDIVIESDEQMLAVINRVLARNGLQRVSSLTPIIDATLPDGSSLNVVAPPYAKHVSVCIRKPLRRGSHGLAALVSAGMLTDEAAAHLTDALGTGFNVVIYGGSRSGKTTLASALRADGVIAPRPIVVDEAREGEVRDLLHLMDLDAWRPGWPAVVLVVAAGCDGEVGAADEDFATRALVKLGAYAAAPSVAGPVAESIDDLIGVAAAGVRLVVWVRRDAEGAAPYVESIFEVTGVVAGAAPRAVGQRSFARTGSTLIRVAAPPGAQCA